MSVRIVAVQCLALLGVIGNIDVLRDDAAAELQNSQTWCVLSKQSQCFAEDREQTEEAVPGTG